MCLAVESLSHAVRVGAVRVLLDVVFVVGTKVLEVLLDFGFLAADLHPQVEHQQQEDEVEDDPDRQSQVVAAAARVPPEVVEFRRVVLVIVALAVEWVLEVAFVSGGAGHLR